MSIAEKKALFELMESEADVKYFLDRPQDGFRAEGPGLIITSGAFSFGGRYTLWFGNIAHWNFKSLRKAEEKAIEVLSKAKMCLLVRVEHKNGKTEFIEVHPEKEEMRLRA